MSKLDNIQTTCDNCEYAPALSETCKERIKALFLGIIDQVEKEVAVIDVTAELRNKVSDL